MAASGPSSLPLYARTAGRAIHLKISPAPGNLYESQQVLRALQQYGEVVMYRHLKHDPRLQARNSALAIFRDQRSMTKLLEDSPLWINVEKLKLPSGVSGHASADRSEGDDTNYEINLRMTPSHLDFHSQIQRQYYYGPFKPDTSLIMTADLAKKVPSAGMADCQVGKGEVPLRVRLKQKDEEKRLKRGGSMESLGRLWEQGRREVGAMASTSCASSDEGQQANHGG